MQEVICKCNKNEGKRTNAAYLKICFLNLFFSLFSTASKVCPNAETPLVYAQICYIIWLSKVVWMVWNVLHCDKKNYNIFLHSFIFFVHKYYTIVFHLLLRKKTICWRKTSKENYFDKTFYYTFELFIIILQCLYIAQRTPSREICI